MVQVSSTRHGSFITVEEVSATTFTTFPETLYSLPFGAACTLRKTNRGDKSLYSSLLSDLSCEGIWGNAKLNPFVIEHGTNFPCLRCSNHYIPTLCYQQIFIPLRYFSAISLFSISGILVLQNTQCLYYSWLQQGHV